MGSSVVQFQPPQQAPVPSFTMSDMERIALAIAKGGLFGSNDPNAVLTLCMVAQAEGKHPAQVMQDYDIIKGKPAKKAQAMLRDFLGSGGTVEWHQLDDDCADATFSHPQGGSVRISWDNERVRNAGLANNDNHKKFARAMKRSRVVSEGVRTVFPGATGGFYVPEEVAEFDAPRSNTPATPQPQRARDLKADEPKQIAEQPADYHATLVELEAICGPGEQEALAEAWKSIGKDARKALADELPRLKSLCEPVELTDAPVNDVAATAASSIIAEIKAALAVLDVGAILNAHANDIAAMPPEIGASVEIAADKRRAEIRAERETEAAE